MSVADGASDRSGKANGRNPGMHVDGKSDGSVVPAKQPNKADGMAAEAVEGRDPIKGNTGKQNASRTQSRIDAHSALERVRKAAKADKKKRFTEPCGRGSTARGVLYFEEACRSGSRRCHVVALWRATGGQPSGASFQSAPRSVPGETLAESVHPQTGWPAAAAGYRGVGG